MRRILTLYHIPIVSLSKARQERKGKKDREKGKESEGRRDCKRQVS